MQYRPFGRLDFQVSALGFGTMRLPLRSNDASDIDEPPAIEMIRRAIDDGVNYVDTAYPYHGGNSERVVGKALKDGYRENVKLATKLPSWAVDEPSDFDRLLDEQCERLQVDFLDFYLLHNLQATLWPKVRDLGALEWLSKAKADGRIGEAGFSFHHRFELFKDVVDSYNWALCQLQYNYMNEDVQAGTEGLRYAADKGLAVVVMEPLLGGCLADPPEQVRAILDSSPMKRTPVDWALQWVWDKPEVATVLSGMGAMEQVEQNLESAERSSIGSLSDGELATVERARDAYDSLNLVPCTACGYCLPCPSGVEIPFNLQLYNDAVVFGGNQQVLNRNIYNGLPESSRASACVVCRECEEKCTQSIPISELMPKVQEQFAQ